MPNTWHAYIGDVHTNICHMKSLTSTIQHAAPYTHLKYITDQIQLPHSEYGSCSQHPVWAYHPNILHIYAKTQPTITSISHVIAKYVEDTNIPSKLGIYGQYYHTYIRDVGNIYIMYDITGTNYSTTSTVHIFDILLNKYGCHIPNTTNFAFLKKLITVP